MNTRLTEMICKLLLLSTLSITANDSESVRRRKTQLFNDKTSKVDVLIINFRVGSLGLNLHLACHYMIILSLPANMNTLLQMMSRIGRLGQLNVQCVHIYTGDRTYDQTLQANITRKYKMQLAGEIRETDDGPEGLLTEEELLQQCEEIITQMLGQRCSRDRWDKKDLRHKDSLGQDPPVHDKALWASGRTREKTSAEQRAAAAHIKQQQERMKERAAEDARRIAAKQKQLDENNRVIQAQPSQEEPSIHRGINGQPKD